eukprot:TRINITY_DN24582_c0_g2_i1.p1 TRINITY_DN24582_c0_g2~~TRINITY_DN24582_c0_g2_i1.p1  ORF type:complete len:296 (+),score=36.91 TRINITY_DN24582_c0_g2_i1:102-890(+)
MNINMRFVEDDDVASTLAVRHSHKVPALQYINLGIWTLVLTVGFTFTRLVCGTGVPPDCKVHDSWLVTLYDLQQLWTFGFILAVFTGVHMPDRFDYVFSFRRPKPRGLAFLAIYFFAIYIWGFLGQVAFFKSIVITPDMVSQNGFTLLLLFSGCVALMVWHFHCAWKHNSVFSFLAYVVSRLAVGIFYISYFWVAAEMQSVFYHIHHYLLAFFLALFAEFNHPVSLVLLSAAAGVFVQGIAAYNADPLIYHKNAQPHMPPMA